VVTLVAVTTSTLTWFLSFSSPDPLFLAPFRESQTAISAEYLIREPCPVLEWQLPVLGSPWRIPFEFPLHQLLSSSISHFGLGVEQAGRLVSLTAFFGCIVVSFRLICVWGLPREVAKVGVALFLTSPLLICYATANMIESLTLVFALLYLWATLHYASGGGCAWFAVALGAGIAAALVKVTTWLPVGFMLSLVLLGKVNRACRADGWLPACQVNTLAFAALLFLPFLVGLLWSRWCEGIRCQNALASVVWQHEGTKQWMFGTLAQRLSLRNWLMVLSKHILLVFGPIGFLAPLVWFAAWRVGGGLAHPWNRSMGLCLAGYGCHLMAFFPLHLRHDYYVYGSGAYLIIAMLFGFSILMQKHRSFWVRRFLPAMCVSMLLGSLVYVTCKRGYHDLAVEQAIRVLKTVPGDEPVVFFGFDYSPRVPLATKRKALMFPDGCDDERTVASVLLANRGVPYCAVMVMGAARDEAAKRSAEYLGLDAANRLQFWPGGYWYSRHVPPAIETMPSAGDQQVFAELAKRVPRDLKAPDGLVFLRTPFYPGKGDLFEVVAKRGSSAFFYRSHGHRLVRVRGYFADTL
jgi:4-amino-4-deoxy-L-arabinose transferase-like glycosyltransferase